MGRRDVTWGAGRLADLVWHEGGSKVNIEQLREQLTEAGSKFDGHVTNGSIAAQLKIVARFIVLLQEKVK